MRYRVAVEDMEPHRYICWALDLPGCYSSANSQVDVMTQAPPRIAEYFDWIRRHNPTSLFLSGPLEVELVEEFQAYASKEDPDYLVNAFFEDDRRSLTYWEVENGLRLLEWSRADLLQVIARLTPEQLHRPIENERRGSIEGILEHICGAENWYFDQFDLSIDWSTLPNDIKGRLAAVRANTRAQLVNLIGDDRTTESCGEVWSARKILRRTLWHERAHTEQIARLAT